MKLKKESHYKVAHQNTIGSQQSLSLGEIFKALEGSQFLKTDNKDSHFKILI